MQKIVNLACGSFYALGAYFGITFIGYAHQFGVSPWLILPGLIVVRDAAGLHRAADRAHAAHGLRPRRELPAAADVCAGADVPGRASSSSGAPIRARSTTPILIYGTISAGDFSVPVYNLLVIAAAIAIAAGLGALPATDQLRPHPARHGREPRHGRGARRRCAPHLFGRLHAWRRARHHCAARWWCRPLRPRSTWRSNLSSRPSPSSSSAGLARCAARWSARCIVGLDPRAFDRRSIPNSSAGDLRDRDRRADLPPGRAVRESRWHEGSPHAAIVAGCGVAALALLPLVVPPYYVGLMIPFFGYAIALARLQSVVRLHRPAVLRACHVSRPWRLWRGRHVGRARSRNRSSSCCSPSCWHRPRSRCRSALLCVRYVGIFFGMLTLAFGMLFHSFLFKFYYSDRRRQRHARGAHEHPRAGIRALQQDRVPGRARSTTTASACWSSPASSCGGSCIRRSDCTFGPFAITRARRNISACTCTVSALRPSSSRRPSAPSAAPSWAFASVLPIPSSSTGRSPASSCSWRCWAAFQLLRADRRRAHLHLAAGSVAIAHAILALRARRHPGADRHRLSRRHCRASPCNLQAPASRGGRHDRAARNAQCQQILRRLPRA